MYVCTLSGKPVGYVHVRVYMCSSSLSPDSSSVLSDDVGGAELPALPWHSAQ